MKRSVAALACAACLCSIAPSTALARVDDAAATRAYLRAGYAYERSVVREAAPNHAAVNARAGQIADECPSALTYAPRDEAFGDIGEMIEATLGVSYWLSTPASRAAAMRLARELARLRWSDRRLTRLVHAEAAEQRGYATLAPPRVCADIAGWRESAYSKLPPDAMRFLARMRAIEALSFVGFTERSRGAIVARLLRRFEDARESEWERRLHRLEAKVGASAEAAEAAAQRKLAAALGVSFL